MLILGIESSCDETSAAFVEDKYNVKSCVIASQIATHKIYGGVVPEIASRMHTEAVSDVVREAVENAGVTYDMIDAVAVTYAPGLIGSLLCGVSFAKGLAFSLGKPLIPVHHLRAHIASCYLSDDRPKPPFIALVASGGHTHIVHVKDYCYFEILGRTRDDAAGEAFDKVARVLGLPYPGGVEIDRLSAKGNGDAFKFPVVRFADNPFDFSFSGVKTAVINQIHNLRQKGEEIPCEDIAASFNKTVAITVTEKLFAALSYTGLKTVAVSGGVCANILLREYIKAQAKRQNVKAYFPERSLCGDNAAMVAAQAFFEYENGFIGNMFLNAKPTSNIEKNYTESI